MKFGELFKFLELTDRFSDSLSRTLFLQLVEGKFYNIDLSKGLEYLHEMGIVHRDIKPENLLIDPKGKLIIGDFGFASDTLSHGREDSKHLIEKCHMVGSEEYNAPELFEQTESS